VSSSKAAASTSGSALTPDRWLLGLLVFVPLAALASVLHWGALTIFVLAALAIVPLAGLMGNSTDRLAARLGAGVGGLLNATFGNAAELILAVVALARGLHPVVQASLTGSILGNALLVLGMAILSGGFGRERQTFDRSAAAVGSTLLVLAAIGLMIPAAFHWIAEVARARGAVEVDREIELEHGLSLAIAIVLFTMYVLSLLFSLHTHRHLYRGPAAAGEPAAPSGTVRGAVIRLVIAAALVAWMSEILVGVVEEASHALGLTPVFVGVVVVAVVGNAAEHSTAVLMAVRNKMDLAMNIAVGSSLQFALFVAPLLVFLSYGVGPQPMDLRFSPFEVLAVGMAVVVVHMVSQDGESNWLEGALLVAVYVILAIAFYFLP
jgi:Ca2+:H+ antiporter